MRTFEQLLDLRIAGLGGDAAGRLRIREAVLANAAGQLAKRQHEAGVPEDSVVVLIDAAIRKVKVVGGAPPAPAASSQTVAPPKSAGSAAPGQNSALPSPQELGRRAKASEQSVLAVALQLSARVPAVHAKLQELSRRTDGLRLLAAAMGRTEWLVALGMDRATAEQVFGLLSNVIPGAGTNAEAKAIGASSRSTAKPSASNTLPRNAIVPPAAPPPPPPPPPKEDPAVVAARAKAVAERALAALVHAMDEAPGVGKATIQAVVREARTLEGLFELFEGGVAALVRCRGVGRAKAESLLDAYRGLGGRDRILSDALADYERELASLRADKILTVVVVLLLLFGVAYCRFS